MSSMTKAELEEKEYITDSFNEAKKIVEILPKSDHSAVMLLASAIRGSHLRGWNSGYADALRLMPQGEKRSDE